MSDSTAEAARREMSDTLRDEAIKRGYEWIAKNKAAIARPPLMNWDHALTVALYIEAYEAGWEARNTQVTVTDEVVESACEAFHAGTNTTWEWIVRFLPGTAARERTSMRAAIAAALEKREGL
jgi:hypothetical protein